MVVVRSVGRALLDSLFTRKRALIPRGKPQTHTHTHAHAHTHTRTHTHAHTHTHSLAKEEGVKATHAARALELAKQVEDLKER